MMYRTVVSYCVVPIAILGACGDGGTAAPVLSDVAVTTPEDTPLGIAVPVTAADASAVALTVVTQPSHGALTGAGPAWTYTPAADYAGPDAVVVQGTDSHGSATATVTITVTPVDDAPAASPDSLATAFDTPLTVAQAALLTNDRDVDSTDLRVTGVGGAVNGTVAISGSDVVFTPEPGFHGVATFVYTVSDGTMTAQGTVSVSVGGDRAPIATGDTAATPEGTALVLADTALLANDSDPDGQTLAISAVGNASHGSVTHTGTHISFAPDPGYHGAAAFDYTVSDGMLTAVATVVVTVSAVDQPPTAVADAATVAESSTANPLDVLANDSDADGGARAVASVTQPGHGTAEIAPDGASVRYTPVAGYCNQAPNTPPDTFTYVLTPGGSTATVAVTVPCACGLHKSTDFVVGSNG